jgi:hypothetical protein
MIIYLRQSAAWILRHKSISKFQLMKLFTIRKYGCEASTRNPIIKVLFYFRPFNMTGSEKYFNYKLLDFKF